MASDFPGTYGMLIVFVHSILVAFPWDISELLFIGSSDILVEVSLSKRFAVEKNICALRKRTLMNPLFVDKE